VQQRLNETYLPLNATLSDFKTVANRIKSLSPDFIFSTVVGAGNARPPFKRALQGRKCATNFVNQNTRQRATAGVETVKNGFSPST